MSRPILSILIPSIPERCNQLNKLVKRLQGQIDTLPVEDVVEYKIIIDNKIQSIGEKREDLKNLATGEYFCFLDDDDDIADEYVSEIYNACKDNNVDVVCFDTWASIDGQIGTISVSHENEENQQFVPGEITYRKPSHVNAWLTDKFKQYHFSSKNYGEDFDFCNECYPHIDSGFNIGKVLHYYIYDTKITRAF